MDETVVIRFRVSDVFRNSFVSMYFDQERVLHRKKTVMAPGEMEEVVIKRTLLEKYPALKEITFKIEKE